MSSTRPGQFSVEMPDGLVVERLPVGLARGVWRLAFVAWGTDLLEGERPRAVRVRDELRERVLIEGVGAPLVLRSGGGASSGDEQEATFEYVANGITGLRITYSHDGTVIATEAVGLST